MNRLTLSANTLVLAAAGIILMTAVGCKREPQISDWSEFNQETVAGALEVLASAERVYSAHGTAGDLDAACVAAVALLDTHPSVARAGVSEDSSVWVLYRSGLWTSITEGRVPAPGRSGPHHSRRACA